MIRKATQNDLNTVATIYHEILDKEAAEVSYTNWQKGLYPTLAYAEEALNQNTLFIGEDQYHIWGCVILNHIQPAEYSNIPWQYDAVLPEEVLVIHTLCIRPQDSGKGKARELVRFSETYARSLGCKVIRLDTYEGNDPASALYTKENYRLAGITKFHFQNVIWENLKCFEKEL